jgi:ribose-phosphate pyrophosphokinase
MMAISVSFSSLAIARARTTPPMSGETTISQVMHIIGDVAGRDCVMVDDMIDTGGTLCKAAEVIDHRVFDVLDCVAGEDWVRRVSEYTFRAALFQRDEFVVCDTIPLAPEIKALDKVRTLTLSGMLAEA